MKRSGLMYTQSVEHNLGGSAGVGTSFVMT
ncbi:hypothetical protein FHS44_003498 [Streptosporangium saharense]|uniref:Uncharacterized protein n=1 Tax=Streptosporangium saharense TaxID=1706840 RepID=A0A7W7VNN1_9ACTN|nr:hypothetical protein [Streptosporangium saharense]